MLSKRYESTEVAHKNNQTYLRCHVILTASKRSLCNIPRYHDYVQVTISEIEKVPKDIRSEKVEKSMAGLGKWSQ